MTGEEQKLVMLNILFRFADFCERNGLAYFLDAGTLLGAVRHKGYIPWDDDIDVNMPYEDYVKFIAMTKEKKGYMEDHLLVEYPTDTIYPFLKISDVRTILVEFPNKYPMEVGVYIDIFPKVGIANDSTSTKLVCKTSYFLHLCQWFNKFSIYAWKNNGNWGKKIIAAVGRKLIVKPNIPVKLQERFISQYARRHPLNQCKYVTTLTNGEYVNRCPKEVFADYIYLDFENKKFRAPKDYNTYLPCLYGASFMQLPPKEKRRVHNTIVYFKNREGKNDINNELERNDIKLNNCDTIETGGGQSSCKHYSSCI